MKCVHVRPTPPLSWQFTWLVVSWILHNDFIAWHLKEQNQISFHCPIDKCTRSHGGAHLKRFKCGHMFGGCRLKENYEPPWSSSSGFRGVWRTMRQSGCRLDFYTEWTGITTHNGLFSLRLLSSNGEFPSTATAIRVHLVIWKENTDRQCQTAERKGAHGMRQVEKYFMDLSMMTSMAAEKRSWLNK